MASIGTRRVGGRYLGGWVIFGLLRASARAFHGRHLLEVLALALVYFAVGRLGLSVATVGGNVSPVWPPTGVALAALVLLGPSRWPGIFLGAWAVTWSTGVTLPVSVGVATGNTLAGVLGALLLRRVGFDTALGRIRDVVALCAGAGAVCTGLSSVLGPLVLVLGDVLGWEDLGRAIRVWWVGDLMGVLVMAPPLLLLKRVRWPRRLGEASLVAGLTAGLGAAIFFLPGLDLSAQHAATFLLFPSSAWAALRFGASGAAAASLAIARWPSAEPRANRGRSPPGT
ncbi:MASE1 domain-containing protein [Pyxidicoccus sp. 3LG]